MIAVALLSPLEALASLLLAAHMIQHQLHTMVAAPLLLLANPLPWFSGRFPGASATVWSVS